MLLHSSFIVWMDAFVSLGVIIRGRTACHMVTLVFNVLRNCQTVSKAAASFKLPPAMYKLPISPHSCQLLLLSVFLIIVILVGVKWYLTAVLICISLMTNDVVHFCFYFFTFQSSLLDNIYYYEIVWINWYDDLKTNRKPLVCCLSLGSSEKDSEREMFRQFMEEALGISVRDEATKISQRLVWSAS